LPGVPAILVRNNITSPTTFLKFARALILAELGIKLSWKNVGLKLATTWHIETFLNIEA
jgi:hypothetical protein